MASAPTISLGLSGVMLCEGYSWVHLCQGCVSVRVGTLTVYTETASHGAEHLLSLLHSFSLAKVGALAQWRSMGVLRTRRVPVWLGRERQSTLRVPQGTVYLWMATGSKGPKGVPGWAARVCLLQLFPNSELEHKAINEAEIRVKWPVVGLKLPVESLSRKQHKQETMSQESKSSSLCLAFFWGTGKVLFTCTTSSLSSAEVLWDGWKGTVAPVLPFTSSLPSFFLPAPPQPPAFSCANTCMVVIWVAEVVWPFLVTCSIDATAADVIRNREVVLVILLMGCAWGVPLLAISLLLPRQG